MKKLFPIVLLVGLAACGDSTPPKPAAQPVAQPAAAPTPPPPQAAAPAPKAPETKAPEAPKPDPNKELARRVKQALEGDAKVHAAEIDVTARGGRVSLWGTAATAADRDRAGQVAAKVDGVASVDNQLKIVKGS